MSSTAELEKSGDQIREQLLQQKRSEILQLYAEGLKQSLQKEGKIDLIGATNFDTTGIFVALAATTCIVLAGNWSVNAVERRLLRWRPASDLALQAGS